MNFTEWRDLQIGAGVKGEFSMTKLFAVLANIVGIYGVGLLVGTFPLPRIGQGFRIKRRLERNFRYVKKTFFPEWDQQNEWEIRFVDNLQTQDASDNRVGSDAECHAEKKQIWIGVIPKRDRVLHLLIIHEINHVFCPGHGKDWADRMKQAQEKAEKLGLSRLSSVLKTELKIYGYWQGTVDEGEYRAEGVSPQAQGPTEPDDAAGVLWLYKLKDIPQIDAKQHPACGFSGFVEDAEK